MCKIMSKGIVMFLRMRAISEIRSEFNANSIKTRSFLNKVLRMAGLVIIMSNVAACSGVPLVPGI